MWFCFISVLYSITTFLYFIECVSICVIFKHTKLCGIIVPNIYYKCHLSKSCCRQIGSLDFWYWSHYWHLIVVKMYISVCFTVDFTLLRNHIAKTYIFDGDLLNFGYQRTVSNIFTVLRRTFYSLQCSLVEKCVLTAVTCYRTNTDQPIRPRWWWN